MKHIVKIKRENIYSVRPVEGGSELSESEVRIMESGFPDKWLVITEDAYGALEIRRLTTAQVTLRFGIEPRSSI